MASPVLTPVGSSAASLSATEDVLFEKSFAEYFADPDAGDVLSYTVERVVVVNGQPTVVPLPTWLDPGIHFDEATGKLSGTPNEADCVVLNADGSFSAQSLTLRITAIDLENNRASVDVQLNLVRVNDAPVLVDPTNPPLPLAVTEGEVLAPVAFSDDFSDADLGDRLTFTAKLDSGAALPSWLIFDSATASLSGTPVNLVPTGQAAESVQALAVKITATDLAGATANLIVPVNVTAVNDSPIVANPITYPVGETALTAREDQAFSYQVPTNTFSDPESDRLIFQSIELVDPKWGPIQLPGWMFFNDQTGILTGTPGQGDVTLDGPLEIRVTVRDRVAVADANTVATSFYLQVLNVNDSPFYTLPDGQTAIASAATERESWSSGSLLDYFDDVDPGDTLTFIAQQVVGGQAKALPAWIQFDPVTVTLSGTPQNADALAGAALTLRVTATDRSGAGVALPVNLTLLPINDAPALAAPLADRFVYESQPFVLQIPAGTFTDPESDPLLYQSARQFVQEYGTFDLPSWLSFNAATRTLSGTPGPDDLTLRGPMVIEIAVRDRSDPNDPDAQVAYDYFNLDVRETNRAPTVTGQVDPQTADEHQLFQSPDFDGVFTDPNVVDVLTFSAKLASGAALPSWLTFNATNASFSGTPENNDVLTALTLRVTATDRASATAFVDIPLGFNKVNDAPVLIGTLSDGQAFRGGSFNKQISTAVFTDPEGDKVYFDSASIVLPGGNHYFLPDWLSFNTTTGTFSGTPGSGDLTGATPLVVEVTVRDRANATDDTAATATAQFNLSVTDSVLAPIPVQVYQWKTHALLQDATVKVDGQTLAWNAGAAGYQFNYFSPESALQVTRIDTARQSAITLKDALATLKLAIGVEAINGTNQAVSPYQRAAADFDGDGSVTLKDALAILKYSIGVTGTANPEWRFYADEAVIPGKTLPAVEYSKTVQPVAVQTNDNLGVVGVLSGDVDGSWVAPAGASTLDTAYFTALVNELKPTDPDVSLARWGIYT